MTVSSSATNWSLNTSDSFSRFPDYHWRMEKKAVDVNSKYFSVTISFSFFLLFHLKTSFFLRTPLVSPTKLLYFTQQSMFWYVDGVAEWEAHLLQRYYTA